MSDTGSCMGPPPLGDESLTTAPRRCRLTRRPSHGLPVHLAKQPPGALIGHTVLQLSRAAVDMAYDRLVHVRYLDLKLVA